MGLGGVGVGREQAGHGVGPDLFEQIGMLAIRLQAVDFAEEARQQGYVAEARGPLGVEILRARDVVAVEVVAKLRDGLRGDERGEGVGLLDEEVVGRRVAAHEGAGAVGNGEHVVGGVGGGEEGGVGPLLHNLHLERAVSLVVVEAQSVGAYGGEGVVLVDGATQQGVGRLGGESAKEEGAMEVAGA